MIYIIIFLIIGIITVSSFISKKEQIKEKKVFQNEMSSFDLNVRIPKPNSDFVELWKNEMQKMGLKVEFHPEFDIENQSGYLPFNIKVIDTSFTNKYGTEKWITGFELLISDFDSQDYFSYFDQNELDAIPENKKKLYKKAKLDFYFSAKPKYDTAEFRITWYAAAALTKLSNGILSEAYSGKEFTALEVVEIAINKTKKIENNIQDKNWNLKKFLNWK